MSVWKNNKEGEKNNKPIKFENIESNYKISDDIEISEETNQNVVDLNDVEVVIDKINDEILNADKEVVSESVNNDGKENTVKSAAGFESNDSGKKEKNEKNSKPRNSGYNGFDRFFITLWSIIAASITSVSKGINWLLKKIFKHEIPIRYLNATISVLLIILIVFLITLPIKSAYESEKIEIYSNKLVAVERSIGVDQNNNIIHKWGYVDHFGKIKIPFEYDEAKPFCNGGAWVRKVKNENGVILNYWVIIDGKGREKSERYPVTNGQTIGDFDKKTGLCWVLKNGKYGFINSSGKVKIDFVFDRASNFSEGLACVKFGDVYYYINKYGKKKSYEYKEIRSLNNGYGALKASNGKWGFVNSNGKEVITCYYDKVGDFIDGYAFVVLGDAIGIIDQNGKYVLDVDYSNISIAWGN